MCGRVVVSLPDLTTLGVRFHVVHNRVVSWHPRYNIAPTQLSPVVTNDEERTLALFRFGLVPSWAESAAIGSKLINARVETVAKKPSFRAALSRRRCIVPVSGYYEWRVNDDDSGKTPFFLRRRDGEVMALAGLWERWVAPGGEVIESFTILTREAEGFVGEIHDRMPFELRDAAAEDTWLSPTQLPKEALERLLHTPPDVDRLEAHPVSSLCSSPANDRPECIEPLAGESVKAPKTAAPQLTLPDLAVTASARRHKRARPPR